VTGHGAYCVGAWGATAILIAMRIPRLGREITAVLMVKLVLLSAIYFLFFAADTRPALDRAAVAQHFFGGPNEAERETER